MKLTCQFRRFLARTFIPVKRFSHQRRRACRRASQCNCWLKVVYLFPESVIFIPVRSLPKFKVRFEELFSFRIIFLSFKWAKFRTQMTTYTVVPFKCWPLNLGWISPMCFMNSRFIRRRTNMLMILSVSRSVFPSWHTSLASEKIWSQKLSYTKPLSDRPKKRPWEEATHTPVCLRLTFWCTYTRNQGPARWGPRRRQVLKDVSRPKSGLLLWRTLQNDSKNIDFFLENNTQVIDFDHCFSVNSNQYGFEQIDPQARVLNNCFR